MTFEDAAAKALQFRQQRDWEQFHNPKDLAISISLEASELLESFQWSGTDLAASERRDHMADELADIAIYCIYFADATGIDLVEAINAKLDANEKKYPVQKSRGSSKKYTELES